MSRNAGYGYVCLDTYGVEYLKFLGLKNKYLVIGA